LEAGPSRAELVFPSGVAPLAPTPRFLSLAGELGLEFDSGDLDQLGRFLGLLLASNKRVNLTAVREPEAAWETLIFDALTLIAVLSDLPPGARVIDVGTGGGLPGVPLAITMPHLDFTLLDATGKKIAFVEHAIAEIGLRNAHALRHRAEVIGASGKLGHRAAYDAVVSRAVGRIAVLAELTVPLAKVGGLVLMVKGQRADAELSEAQGALRQLHAAHVGTVTTPTGRIVILEKRRPTPGKLPRTAAEIKKNPLR